MALRLIITALLVLSTPIAPAAIAQRVEGIVAVVNDEPITTLDVRDRMRLIISSGGVQPTPEALELMQSQALRGLVDERLQLQAAAEFEVDVTDEEVDASLNDTAMRNGSTFDQIVTELAASGISIETLRQQIRAEMAWQILVSGRYRSRIRISDAQIQTAIDRIIRGATQPQVDLGEIFVELPASGDEAEAQATIQTIYAQLGQQASFALIAQQFSDAPSAANGGRAGYLALSQMRPQVAEIAAQLQPGQISNPIRVPGGYMIIAVIDRRDGAAVEQLELVQATLLTSQISDERRSDFEDAAARINGCDGVEALFGEIEGAFATNLGSVSANALVEDIRNALTGVEAGQASAVLETAAGLQVFVVCDRAVTGPGVPTSDQVENQLIGQQLNLLARRWLRDLRRDATVEYR
ncbi:MAG: peptidylprolyl isomerase [Pseudomonadota bacterium]